MAEKARNELTATLQSLFKSGDFSDFIITCGSDEYKVHRAIVCARSEFFRRAVHFNGQHQKNVNKVNLSDDNSNLVKLLVQYLYEGEYAPALPDGKEMETPRLQVSFKGDRLYDCTYDFPHTCVINSDGKCRDPFICPHHHCDGHGKKRPCVEFICKTCCPKPESLALPPPDADAAQLQLHAEMYELADKYVVSGLKDLAREKFLRAAFKYFDTREFAIAAHYAFSTTPEEDKGLRDVVCNIIAQHMTLLNNPAIEALLTEFNGLAVALLKARGKDLGWIKI